MSTEMSEDDMKEGNQIQVSIKSRSDRDKATWLTFCLTVMPSPPIQLFLTTIASQPALRQRQGEITIKQFAQSLMTPFRVPITRSSSQKDTFYFI